MSSPEELEGSRLSRSLFGDWWSVVAPRRAGRPSRTAGTSAQQTACPFCEGNEHETEPEVHAVRAEGSRPDSPGWQIRVVPNKYPALTRGAVPPVPSEHQTSTEVPGWGLHEVIIESPVHGKRLSAFTPQELLSVLEVYRARIQVHSAIERVAGIALFRNEGGAAGASQDHPHAQLIALPVMPARLERELGGADRYFRAHGSCPTCDRLEHEEIVERRIIDGNERFLAVASAAPRFPYESWILPRMHAPSFADLDTAGLEALALLLNRILGALDSALGAFPSNLVIQTLPAGAASHAPAQHWRLEILPRVTTPSGFELGGDMFIVSVAPEQAAAVLREGSSRARDDSPEG